MKKFFITLTAVFGVSFLFGQEVSRIVHPNLMRTCIHHGSVLTASDCSDRKLDDVAIMRWDNDSKISVMGKESEGFGQIYQVVSTKQNQQRGYLEWYVREIRTGEVALIVFDDEDHKVAIDTKTSLKAFYFQ